MSLQSAPIGDITLGGETYRGVTAVSGRYGLGDGLAIQLYTEGEPLTSLTVNVPSDKRPGPFVWAKDYSENEGLIQQLEEQGLVRRTGNRAPSGWVLLDEIELLGALRDIGLASTAPGQAN